MSRICRTFLLVLVVFCTLWSIGDAAPITYGSAVRLRSENTKYFLQRNGYPYYKTLSTNILAMGQINGVHYLSPHNIWFIRVAVGKPQNADIGKPIKNGDIVRIYNAQFKDQLLHASALSQGHKAPHDIGGMVTSLVGNGDSNSNWVIQAVDEQGVPLKKGVLLDSTYNIHLIHHNGSDANITTVEGKEFLKMFPKLYNPFSPEKVSEDSKRTYVREQIVALVKEPSQWSFYGFANYNDSYMHIPNSIHKKGQVSFNSSWKLKVPGTGSVLFKSRAKNDIYVVFASQVHTAFDIESYANPGDDYRFIIGGLKNTATEVRRHQSGSANHQILYPVSFLSDEVRDKHKVAPNLANINPNTLITGGLPKDGDTWEYYWFKVNQGNISWGKGKQVGQNILANWTDQKPLTKVQYIGFGGLGEIVEVQDITIDEIPLAPPISQTKTKKEKQKKRNNKKKKKKKRKRRRKRKKKKKKKRKKKKKKRRKNKRNNQK